MNTKKITFFTVGIFIFIFIVLYIVALIINSLSPIPQETTISPTPTGIIIPTSSIPQISGAPESTLNIPTQSPSLGGGVDLENMRIQRSTEELVKIRPILPYYQNLALSTGVEVSVSISETLLNARPWVLTVFVDGIDFFVPDDDPSYDLYRASFREAANIIFSTLRQNGVDTSVIFVNWGDQEFTQERAELWLR